MQAVKFIIMQFSPWSIFLNTVLKNSSENILEEIKVDPVEKKSAQYKQKRLNVNRKEDIQNSLTIDLSEDEDLDDR